MDIDYLINNTSEWLKDTGPQAEIVLSSRIRLARNIVDFPFPTRTDKETTKKVLSMGEKAVKSIKEMKGCFFRRMLELDEVDRLLLIERHLISREQAANQLSGGVAVSANEVVSIMINEEDHVRIQVIKSGFQLMRAWQVINQVDTDLERSLRYAFSPTFGYLTACPTNVGTGMRASVMVHLPALVLVKQIGQVIQAVMKLGLAVRGLYGEGSEMTGNLFQISNQVTLGKTEEDIVDNIEKVLRQIIGHEKNARELLKKNDFKRVQDRVGRAYGLLKHAHIITSKETIELLSALKMGLDMGLVTDMNRSSINELFILTQPAHLQKVAGKKLGSEDRDIRRAKLIRDKLTK